MIQKKPTLLIDQDDVLAEYIKGVVKAFNKKFGTTFSHTDCVDWNLKQIFGEDILEVMHEPELFKTLEPTPYGLEVFKRLYESQLFEMYIVTAAHPRAVEAKFWWIEKYLPFFPLNRVMVCSEKYMVKGDFLFDDGMHNIEAFKVHGGHPIVFKRPHNSSKIQTYDYVNNWYEFEQMIIEKCYKEKAEEYFSKIDMLKEKAI